LIPVVAMPGVSFQSLADGVTHPETFRDTHCPSVSPNPLFPYFFAYFARRASSLAMSVDPKFPASGVGHPASHAVRFKVDARLCPLGRFQLPGSALSGPREHVVSGVGHPEQPLADVRGCDARRAQIGGPDRISQCFQVSTYSGEPFTSKAARNLLSKDDWRAAVLEEPAHVGPEVALVGLAAAAAGVAERLARAGAGPAGRSSGHPASRRAWGQPPMPANRWT
jgi:hypothetical protein